MAVTLRLEMLTCHSNRGKPSCNSFSHFMKYNLDLSLGWKNLISFICVLIFSTLHIGVVLLFLLGYRLWIVDTWKKKISKNWEQGGITYLPWKMRTSQHNTKCCNVTFVHIAVLGTAWNLDALHNSSDLNQ